MILFLVVLCAFLLVAITFLMFSCLKRKRSLGNRIKDGYPGTGSEERQDSSMEESPPTKFTSALDIPCCVSPEESSTVESGPRSKRPGGRKKSDRRNSRSSEPMDVQIPRHGTSVTLPPAKHISRSDLHSDAILESRSIKPPIARGIHFETEYGRGAALIQEEEVRGHLQEKAEVECYRPLEELKRKALKPEAIQTWDTINQQNEKSKLEQLEWKREKNLKEEQLKREREEVLKQEQLKWEQLKREQFEREREEKLRQEQLKQEQLKREQFEREREEKLRQEQLKQEQFEREQFEREREEKLRQEQLKQEQFEREREEKLRQEQLKQEQLKREQLKREREEKLRQEQLKQEQLKREQFEREREEKLRQEQLKQEQLKQEQIEREREEELRQEQLKWDQVKQAQIPQCKLSGCDRPCYVENTGRVHDFCSRTHASQYSQQLQGPGGASHYHVNHTPTRSTLTSNSQPIHFYNKDEAYYEFTNFYESPVWIDDRLWRTTESYFQAQKYIGTPLYDAIQKCQYARDAFRISRSPQGSRWRRKDWEEVKVDVMRVALYAKYTQHQHLRDLLLGTGEREIVEHTSNDSFWGDGGDGRGQNVLGKLLMELRGQLLGTPV